MHTTAISDTTFTLDPSTMRSETIARFRLAFVISGSVAMTLGIVTIIWPVKTVSVLTVALGIFFVTTGTIRIAIGILSIDGNTGHRLLSVTFGLLLVGAGITALRSPAASAAMILVLGTIAAGIGWICDGITSILESRGAPSPGLAITYGALAVIAGITVVSVPLRYAEAIVWLAGFTLILLGSIGVIRGITFGRARS